MTIISWQFLLACLAVIITPGPDLAFLTSVLMRGHGRRPAVLAASGMVLAGGCHALLGICGMSLILSSHPGVFRALRTAGAAVLAAYGLLMLRAVVIARFSAAAASTPQGATDSPRKPLRHPLLSGFACTAANPKVGVFLLAFLPQFAPRATSTGAVLLPLAAVYLGMVALWLGLWIQLVSRLQDSLRIDRIRPGVELVVGAGLLLFAAKMAYG
ncbi:MAG: LysE family translocator [Jatrophihabitantaceae bacterium]